jgi:dolichol-phosphate mannosyltransferase
VVPALNEAGTLAALLDKIKAALSKHPNCEYEVIFVDDGSTDGSWAVMQLLATNGGIRAFRLRRNFGKATALSIGAEKARGEIIVTMDADLQDDPEEIGNLLAKLNDGWDLVCGFKKDRRDPLSKRFPSKLFNFVAAWASGLALHDFNCGLKVGKREVFLQIPLYGELHRYIPALAHNLGYRVTELPVVHHPRTIGHSKYGAERLARGLLDSLTVLMIGRYGWRPAHLFGGIGIAVGLVGLVILIYLSAIWLFTDEAIGHRPLLLLGIMLEILGTQLVALGLVAELIISRTPERQRLTLVAEEARIVQHDHS